MRVALWMFVAAMMLGCVGGDDASTSDGGAKDGAIDSKTGDSAGQQCVFGTSHFGDGCQFGQ